MISKNEFISSIAFCLKRVFSQLQLKIMILLVFAVFFSTRSVKAQEVWKRNYHMQNAYTKGFDAFESYDNGYMFVATLQDAITSFTYGWVVKTDINGYKIWDKTFGKAGGTDLICMNKTNDGGVIVGGIYYGDDYTGDAYVMKLNSCAEPEWCSVLPDIAGESYGSYINVGIVELPDGSFICERTRYTYDQYSRLSLIKLGKSGVIEWINYYDTNYDYMGQYDNDLILTSDTCILVAGTVYDTIYPGYPYLSTFPHFYKVDADGNLMWEQKWYINPFEICGEPLAATEDIHGNYFCGGFKLKQVQPYIYKLSADGDTLNSYKITDHPQAVGGVVTSVNFMNDTTLVVNTACWRDLEDDFLWSLNLTDTAGNKKTGIFEQEDIGDMIVFITSDNKIILKANAYEYYPTDPFNVLLYKFNPSLEYDSIYTTPRIYDSLCPHPIVSDTIEMPGNCINYVSLPELPSTGEIIQLKTYPNPASSFLSIEIPEYSVTKTQAGTGSQQQYKPITGELLLQVFNLSGQTLQSKIISASERNQVIDIQNLPAGIYLLTLSQSGKILANAKIVIVNQ
jgi:hypothetical protein